MKTNFTIDPAHSTAQVVARHMMITNVRGSFSNVQGKVTWDPENPEESTVEATIDASTIQTGVADRDTHLKSADFLEVEKFPSIEFRSTKVTVEGPGEAKLAGDLTIHGVTRPVVLKVEGPTVEGKDPWGNTRIGASATTKIKRSDFGLKWNAALETGGVLVGDDLKIEIEVSLIRS